MFRFTIRDLLCLMTVVAMAIFPTVRCIGQVTSERLQARNSESVQSGGTGGFRAVMERERRALMSLDRKVPLFNVKNGSLSRAVTGLRWIGVDVCFEAVDAAPQWYVDSDSVGAFSTDRLFAISLKDVSVREILDAICKDDPRYHWKEAADGKLVVLEPRERSRLQFKVGPVKGKGHPLQ